jgi:thiamine-phosphate pyrophosphorylase
MSTAPPPRPRTRLYLITPPQVADAAAFAKTLDAALSAGDVASLQLRLKGADGMIDMQATRELGRAVIKPCAGGGRRGAGERFR